MDTLNKIKHSLSCKSKRRNSVESYSSVARESDENEDGKTSWWQRRERWQKIIIIIAIVIFSLAFLIFLAIWIIVPIVFMLSIAFQRFMMFLPIDAPKNPDYGNPSYYGLEKAYNTYITVLDLDNKTLLSIGAWVILPYDEMDTITTSNINEILGNTTYDIVLYLHGVACNRAQPIHQYEVIRRHFLVISIDHRGYGDSGLNVDQTELGIVNDHLQIYNWIRLKTKNDIYYWGHSLGCALGTHTVRALKETRNIVPKGLILESPFSTMREEVYYNFLGKIFRWLAYFNQTVLDPLEDNKFHFRSTTNILTVDCPIMIMHAEDDNVIPYFLGKKLAEVAITKRNLQIQGNVTYHQFPALGYSHNDITKAPQVPQYVEDFRRICKDFNLGT